ncbi:MAG: hypothetical protein LBS21_13290 [Clostridiales bacterium]|nr:hypothetical protein [Clostridiales bacterium]
METESVLKTVEFFKCANADLKFDEELFNYWVKPDIFEDTFLFLEQNPLPVCIVSNIDRNDILRAIKHHGMAFENVVTSEDAKSYKRSPKYF